MANQTDLCRRAQRELEYAGATLQRCHLLMEMIADSLGGADPEPTRTRMLAEIAAELLEPAGERALVEAEFFYSGGRDE